MEPTKPCVSQEFSHCHRAEHFVITATLLHAAKAGFSRSYDQQLLDLAEKTQPSELAKHVGILIDEMYVKEGLVYNKNSGALTGFVELGQTGRWGWYIKGGCTDIVLSLHFPFCSSYVGDIDSHLNEYERCLTMDAKKRKNLAKTVP